jgi:hypothetical protein
VPTMSTAQKRKITEFYRPKFLFCGTCGDRSVLDVVYIKRSNHGVQLYLVCPNYSTPHPDGHDVGHLLLEPEAVREVGL